MTDYELFAALHLTLDLLWTIFATYISVVFAFLVASYLVAGKLAPTIVLIVITLYSLVSFWAISGLYRTVRNTFSVIKEMQRAVLESGSDLSWSPIVGMPEFTSKMLTVLSPSIGLIAYIGSIIFFFYQRKIELTERSK